MVSMSKPRAYSIDGEEFNFEVSLETPFTEGDFIEIKVNKREEGKQPNEISYLGQITDKSIIIDKHTETTNFNQNRWFTVVSREIRGKGKIIGRIENDGLSRTINKVYN